MGCRVAAFVTLLVIIGVDLLTNCFTKKKERKAAIATQSGSLLANIRRATGTRMRRRLATTTARRWTVSSSQSLCVYVSLFLHVTPSKSPHACLMIDLACGAARKRVGQCDGLA